LFEYFDFLGERLNPLFECLIFFAVKCQHLFRPSAL